MKTNKEIAAVAQSRAKEINKNKRNRRMGTAGLAAACIMLIVGLSYAVSQMAQVMDYDVKPGDAYSAATITGGSTGGYVLVGVIAFALGVMVTIIAMRSRKK